MATNLEILKSEIETEHETHLEEMASLIEDGMRKVGHEWQERNPKRPLRFMDAMGVFGWLIKMPDGKWEWIEHLVGNSRGHGDLYAEIFSDLVDSEMWYADITTLIHIVIEFELEPLENFGEIK